MSSENHLLPSTAALRAFETAARLLSFTATAAELGQTQAIRMGRLVQLLMVQALSIVVLSEMSRMVPEVASSPTALTIP